METSGKKLYAFNASSFSLDAATAEFLESRGAVSLDLGSYAYINSDAMPAMLAELAAKAAAATDSKEQQQQQEALVAQLRSELAKQAEERQRLIGDSSRLAIQAKSLSSEALALKDQLSAAGKTIEALRSENSRLQQAAIAAAAAKAAPPAAPAAQSSPAADPALRQSYDRLLREFQQLRSQSIEAITSLKVLEEENAALQEEVEALRAQAKNAAAPGQPKAA